MVAGVTRNFTSVFQDVRRVMDAEPGRHVIGVSLALCRGRAVLIADTSVHDMPDAHQLANIAVEAARAARKFGIEPRVAMLAYSTFGHPRGERSDEVRKAVTILDERDDPTRANAVDIGFGAAPVLFELSEVARIHNPLLIRSGHDGHV